MKALVALYDDFGEFIGKYDLTPSRIVECDIVTKYVFSFEYHELNYGKKERRNDPRSE